MKSAIGILILFMFHMSLLAYGNPFLERKNALEDGEAVETKRGQNKMVLDNSLWKRNFYQDEDFQERLKQFYDSLTEKPDTFAELIDAFLTNQQNAGRAFDKKATDTKRDDDKYVLGNDKNLLKRSNAIDFRSLKDRFDKRNGEEEASVQRGYKTIKNRQGNSRKRLAEN